MKLSIVWTNQFKKDYKLAIKRGLRISLLDDIIRKLSLCEELPVQTRFQEIILVIENAIFSLIGC